MAVAALVAGCAVAPAPTYTSLRGQGEREHAWDVQDCRAEAAYQSHYNPDDSPLANLAYKVFFWGTAGASLGGVVTGYPVMTSASCAATSDALIAGAGAGGIVAGVESLSGRRRFDATYAACMEAKGYGLAPRVETAEGAPVSVMP